MAANQQIISTNWFAAPLVPGPSSLQCKRWCQASSVSPAQFAIGFFRRNIMYIDWEIGIQQWCCSQVTLPVAWLGTDQEGVTMPFDQHRIGIKFHFPWKP